MPITQSLLNASFTCTLVVLRVRLRVVRYSTLHVKPLSKDTSTPSSGEKASLMLTVLTLYMLLGTGLPVVASVMKPMSPMLCIHVLNEA